jgi:fumarylacetoacetate (FAA) hydrolase
MKLVTYTHPAHGAEPRAGVLQGDRVLNASRLLEVRDATSVLHLLEARGDTLASLDDAARAFAADHEATVHVPRDLAVPAWETTLLAPVQHPPSIRDFFAFERHVAAGYRPRGRDIPAAWYETPVFYFGHTGNLLGPDAPVPKPAAVRELDFELELAAVIGSGGREIPAARAWQHIAGFTVMNDWSARDIQRQEMSVGLGPAKGKDFATSFGPALVTLDELADRIDGDRISLTMIARVNGDEVGRDDAASMHWSFPALIEAASRHVDLRPGDIIGSGTCGGGCIFELGADNVPWLEPGDEVELEIEFIGRLRNTIAG